MATAEATAVKPKVAEALPKDLGRGLARFDPADMTRLGVSVGDIVTVSGKRATVVKAMPSFKDHRGQSRVQIDGVTRENAGAAIDQMVEIAKVEARAAQRVVLEPMGIQPGDRDLKYIGSLFDGLPVLAGDRVRAQLFGNRAADFKVIATTPSGPVMMNPTTQLEVVRPSKGQPPRGSDKESARPIAYEDIGGLKRELHRIREIVELPLRYPEVFERLGIGPTAANRGTRTGRRAPAGPTEARDRRHRARPSCGVSRVVEDETILRIPGTGRRLRRRPPGMPGASETSGPWPPSHFCPTLAAPSP